MRQECVTLIKKVKALTVSESLLFMIVKKEGEFIVKNFLSASVVILLSACASDPIDPLDPRTDLNQDRVEQCPIGYHMEQSTSIVIASGDKDKKRGKTQTEQKCVPDK